MEKCPKTAAEAFKRLDKRLTQEEKQQIVEAEDMIEFHFGLGLWIRNNWIYGGEKVNLKSLLIDVGEEVVDITDGFPIEGNEEDAEPMLIGHPDDFSSIILEAYQKHLKEIM